jgi:asparagine synthase (glutamine-hydrolysing)
VCGFVVVLNRYKFLPKEIISSMKRDIFHRGPDSSGYYAKRGFSLIFRRLSILDLRKVANQPMIDKENGLSLVFNGEIYNYLELKNFLKKKGYKFKTNSDTEVILNGFKYWGKNILNKLNGMFAFTIIDEKKNIAFVARDHFGIKPLYFFKNKNFIFF